MTNAPRGRATTWGRYTRNTSHCDDWLVCYILHRGGTITNKSVSTDPPPSPLTASKQASKQTKVQVTVGRFWKTTWRGSADDFLPCAHLLRLPHTPCRCCVRYLGNDLDANRFVLYNSVTRGRCRKRTLSLWNTPRTRDKLHACVLTGNTETKTESCHVNDMWERRPTMDYNSETIQQSGGVPPGGRGMN